MVRKMDLNLDNKNALICGSSQGIGKAIALQFAEMGANVILLARNEDKLKETVNQLANNGNQKHSYITANLDRPNDLIKKVKNILTEYGIIQLLVNNSGGPAPGSIFDASTSDLESAFRQHIISSQLLTQLLVDGMKKSNFGRIINIISIGLKQPIENLGVSNTIRGAMGSWSKTLSRELAQFGITVNNILPGYTLTNRLLSLFEHRAKEKKISIEEEQNNISMVVPAQRLGKPEEIAFAVSFLASEQASYINGINLPVDGGFLSSL